jgi:hypothetical protein
MMRATVINSIAVNPASPPGALRLPFTTGPPLFGKHRFHRLLTTRAEDYVGT